MNNATQNISTHGICRPYGAWLGGEAFTIKTALLTELGGGIYGVRLFYDQIRSHHLLEQRRRGLHRGSSGTAWMCRGWCDQASRAEERRCRYQGVDCHRQGTWPPDPRTQRPLGFCLSGMLLRPTPSPVRGGIFVATGTMPLEAP